MHQQQRRSFRGLVISTLAAAAILVSGGSALGAHQISQTGTPGDWVLPDSAANPAARCRYNGGGTAGGTYLTGIKLRNDVELWGTGPDLQSVGFRPIIQHKVGGIWKTVKKGTLITGQASGASSVVLHGGRTSIPVTQQPKNPFRLVLRLIWYTGTASDAGTRKVLVDSYIRRDGGVAGKCKGFVSDF